MPPSPVGYKGNYWDTAATPKAATPSVGTTYTQGQNVGGGVVQYDSNTGQKLAPGQSFTLPSPTPVPIPSQNLATTPVVTSAAAEKDYQAKLLNFQQLTDSVKAQKSILAQQAAQQAADEAGKQVELAKQKLEQQKLGIQQQQANTQQADAEAKRQALSLSSSSSTTTSTPTVTPTPGQTPEPLIGGTKFPTPPQDSSFSDLNQAIGEKIGGLAQIQDVRDQLTEQSNQALQSLLNGTIPLSGPQQSLISSLQNQLVQHEQEQKVANDAYTGAVTVAGFRAGGEYTPAQYAGQIHNAVSAGVAKIQALDNSAAKVIAELEQGFQKDNFDIINKQFDNLNKTLDQKADAIKDTYATVSNAIKDARDFQYKATQDAISNQMKSDEFTYKQKQDAIDNAFKRGQLNETQRHNMAMEAISREPSPKEKKEIEDKLKNAKSAIPVMQDKIKAIDAIKTHDGLNSRVGTTFFTRTPTGEGVLGTVKKTGEQIIKAPLTGFYGTEQDIADSVTGAGQDFAAQVHKVTAGLSLESLIEAKARGATFGALSDSEMRILSNSATTLSDWEIKDKSGKGTGVWNIDEKSFNKELDNIKELTTRALVLSNESLVDAGEESQLDSLFGPSGTSNQALDPSSFY